MKQRDSIAAIRSVRLAAHELSNVCAAIVGGTEMAISLPTVDTLGEPLSGLKRRLVRQPRGSEQ